MKGPVAWDAANGVYYVEFDYSGLQIYGKRDLQFGVIAAQDSSWKSNWDPTNDWSRQGLTSTATATTQYAPVYLNGALVFGKEPPCSGTGCSVGGGGGGGPGGGGGGASYVLTVAKSGIGSGTVSSSPAGISCGSACSAGFSSGTSVTLTATAASGSAFTGWSGACTGTSTCTVTMSAAKSVTATFGVAADTVPPSTPANLSASSVTSTTVVLSWSPSTDNVGVAMYDIYSGSELAGSTATSSATIQNLLPASTYTFTVKARDGAGNVSSASAAAVVTTLPSQDITPPSAPGSLLWTSAGGTVTLSWAASTDDVGVVAYQLYFGSFYLGSFDGTSLALIGFKSGTPYTFTVKARDAAGNVSLASNQATVLLAAEQDTTPPTAPTNLVASNVTSTSLTLKWTASTDNVGVVVYQVFAGSTQVATTFGTTSAGISGLTASGTYSFTVKALDAANNVSSASAPLSVTLAVQ
jgi:chitodextrinase